MQKTKPIIVQDDPWLDPYVDEINARTARFQRRIGSIEDQHNSLLEFSNAHRYFGFHLNADEKNWSYREWAPAAHQLYLFGEFNNWDRTSHPMTNIGDGIWELELPEKALAHGSLVKLHVVADNGSHDRIPAYINRVLQDDDSKDFSGQIWQPKTDFKWTDQSFDLSAINKNPLIYEAHVGIAQDKKGLGSYREFADNILPRIKKAGYTVVQLMAIKEHPYYGSFGYHVSNYFAPSSRFGSPEDLKYLVNTAHEMGLAIIMDLVHSHAVKNFSEGLNDFDGSGGQYFHEGDRGYHKSWDSKLFNYGKEEVQEFLLSNIKYWMNEFHMDGFRFDGITSMLYHHHGDFMSFDHYDKYFVSGVDWDAMTYLQMANELVHQVNEEAITIAEDFSGMPGLCRKPEAGGLGFDFRLGMGIPDFWIKYLKERSDENWDINEIFNTLNNRRYKEKTIAYAESHDQAIVGDKSIAFRLMDKEMYDFMAKDSEHFIIDRGLALHKLIRLITSSLGGEGYLNFIGNEFGHPEWVDFPRAGNNWSYHYARRQWSLVDNPKLKFEYFNNFDQAMIKMLKDNDVLSAGFANQLNMDTHNNVIIFERGELVFVFNFNPNHAIPDYEFHVPNEGDYQLILCSDDAQFGGMNRVNSSMMYTTVDSRLKIYNTNRTAMVFKRIS